MVSQGLFAIIVCLGATRLVNWKLRTKEKIRSTCGCHCILKPLDDQRRPSLRAFEMGLSEQAFKCQLDVDKTKAATAGRPLTENCAANNYSTEYEVALPCFED